MATRFYLHNAQNQLLGTFPSGEQGAGTPTWTGSIGATPRKMDTAKGSAQVQNTATSAASTARQYGLMGIWVSPALAAQTIAAQNLTINTKCNDGDLAANFWVGQANVYIWRPSTGAKVATLYDGSANANAFGQQSTVVGDGQVCQGTVALSAGTAQSGDVVICELWANFTQGIEYGVTCNMFFDGDTVNTANGQPNPAGHAAFIEFANNLTFSGGGITATLQKTLGAMTTSSGGASSAPAGNRALFVRSGSAAAADAHYGAQALTADIYTAPITYKGRIRTTAQVRSSGSPAYYETAYAVWAWTGELSHYYLAIFTNGWELSRRDGDQGNLTLKSGSANYAIGQWVNFEIRQTDNNIVIILDGVTVASVVDSRTAYQSGKLGIFVQDAEGELDDVTSPLNVNFDSVAIQQVADGGSINAGNASATQPVLSSPDGNSYLLTLEDKFDGTSLNATRWAVNGGAGNFEVSNGKLRIWPDAGFSDISIGTAGSGGNFRQAKGYFEARLRFPRGQGIWAQFLAQNNDDINAGGRAPQIDIVNVYPGDANGTTRTNYWADYSQHPNRIQQRVFADGQSYQVGSNSYNVEPIVSRQPVSAQHFGMHLAAQMDEGFPTDYNAGAKFGTQRTWDSWINVITARPGVSWIDLNPSNGTYTWDNLDALVNNSTGKSPGIEFVYAFGYVPAWVNGGSQTAAPTDAAWTNFVTAIVNRYKDKIKYWEIWNEPNASNFWSGTTAQMVHMAELAAPIIRNAGCKVVSPSPQGSNAYQWLDGFLAAGGGQYVDIYAYHGYNGSPEGLITTHRSVEDVLNKYGVGEAPIWDTEHSFGDTTDSATWPYAGTDTKRSQYVARYEVLSASLGIDRSAWYGWEVAPWGTLFDKTANTVLPAGTAWITVRGWLFGATVSTHKLTGTRYEVSITDANGVPGVIVWTSSGTSSFTVPANYTTRKNIDGTSGSVTSGSSLTVTETPVLLLRSSGGAAAQPADLREDFHTYGCRWTDAGITFFVDGVQTGNTSAQPYAAFNQLSLLLSLRYGGAGGTANGSTVTGKGNPLEADYVRAWSLGSGSGGWGFDYRGASSAGAKGGIRDITTSTPTTPPATSDINIVDYYGTSFIYGYDGAAGGGRVARPQPERFATHFSGMTMHNEGVNSSDSTKMLAGTDGVHPQWDTQIRNSTAGIIFICYGFFESFDLTPDQFKSNLRQMVNTCKTYNRRAILQTTHKNQYNMAEMAQATVEVAAELGVQCIDVYTWSVGKFTGPIGDWCPDGYHPNQATYDLIGDYVASQFEWKPVTDTGGSGGGGTGVQVGPDGQDASQYHLTFEDHFEGTALDTSKWSDRIWYVDEVRPINYKITNSLLKVWPLLSGGTWVQREFGTHGKFEQLYGFFEFRAKLPRGRGMFPALWLFHHATEPKTEIDILEAYPGSNYPGWGDSNLHPIDYVFTVWNNSTSGQYDQAGTKRMSGGYASRFPAIDLSASFHTYGCRWDTNGITPYFDGQLVGVKSPAEKGNIDYGDTLDRNEGWDGARYDSKPMYFLIDLWYDTSDQGGGAPNTSDTPQGEQNSFEIDYVRAWGFGGTGGSGGGGSQTPPTRYAICQPVLSAMRCTSTGTSAAPASMARQADLTATMGAMTLDAGSRQSAAPRTADANVTLQPVEVAAGSARGMVLAAHAFNIFA